MRAKFWYSNSASGTCICVLTLVYILSHTKVVRLAIFSFSQAKVRIVGWMHQCCQHWCRKQYLRRSQISRYHTSHHYTQAIPLVSTSHIGIVEFIVYYSWELLLFIDGGIMVQFPAGEWNLFVLKCLDSFWGRPLPFVTFWGQEWVECYLCALRCLHVVHRDNSAPYNNDILWNTRECNIYGHL